MSKLTVIISQSQSRDPRKRALEEEISASLAGRPELAVSAVPHLYDLHEGHAAAKLLRSVAGPLVVLAWLYPRAIHWTLHRLGVQGRMGRTLLKREAAGDEKKPAGAVSVPDRVIWSLDLQDGDAAAIHVQEILRIAADAKADAVAGEAKLEVQDLQSANPPARRWYPVIDYQRCTNCMECIEFCLFGVYGVDDQARILVESQDECRKGCPACSRVCPENAIVFPMHRTPAIAGAPGAGPGDLKLDLSQLFGAPAGLELAAKERDAALAAAGQAKAAKPKDDLDRLMDALDDSKL